MSSDSSSVDDPLTHEQMLRCLLASAGRVDAVLHPMLEMVARVCNARSAALLVVHEREFPVLVACGVSLPASVAADDWSRAALASAPGLEARDPASSHLAGWLIPQSGRLFALPITLAGRVQLLLALALPPDADERGPPPDWSFVQSFVAGALAQFCRAQRAESVLRGIEGELPGFVFEYEESTQRPGRFLYVSRRLRELIGVDAQTLATSAKPFFDLVSEEQVGQMRESFQQARKDGRPVRGQLRLSLPDGRLVWLMGCASAVVADDVIVWHGMAFDATGLMRLREEKARAESDSRKMSDFVSRVTHEIRTPLAGLLGYIQLMNLDRADPLSEPQRRRLEQIELAGHRLMELVNSVLDLSRIEHGKDTLVLESVDLTEVIDETLTLLEPLADAHGVRFEFQASELSAVAQGDRRALIQVLTNLLSNAIKFNRPGGRVRVSVHRRPGRLRLAVSDEGVGLTADEIDQLFTPFRRFQRSRRGVEGTGLGLTIARRLTEAMGGTIQVWSHPGDGATFEVELARVDDVSVRESVAGEPVLTKPSTPLGLSQREAPQAKILYVEDDRLNAAVFAAACERFPQWQVHIAASVDEARTLLRRFTPDLLVTDLSLPDGSGQDVLRHARTAGGMQNRPIVALSATTAPERIRAALDAGFDDYWVKPIDVASMLASIVERLSPSSAGSPTP
ncbi:MAG: ATP-binding protein [Burkholderiaceae bacterium]